MRLTYKITSKLAGYGIISQILWVLVIPFFKDGPWFMGATINAAIGLLAIYVAVYFQNKEEYIELNVKKAKGTPT